jgi:hypothetical protein
MKSSAVRLAMAGDLVKARVPVRPVLSAVVTFEETTRRAGSGRLRPVASRGWVGSGGFQRGGKGQSYVPLQVGAFDGAPPLTGCVKLFCRKISPRVELSYVCVDLYFSGVSFRVSPNL